MNSMLKIGCAQITATPDPAHNLDQAASLLEQAGAEGLDMVVLPEAFDFLAPGTSAVPDHARSDQPPQIFNRLATLARENGLWLVAGSVSTINDAGEPVNRQLMFDPGGTLVAYYDKIHMFDVDLPNGDPIRESDLYRPGERAVIAQTPWGGIGMSICYDVRFPHLFRSLAKGGAKVLLVPAAFSSFTGPLHWQTLLQARAIETGCFVVAPAQCGDNHEGRRSHGHSLIIDPWGRILAEAADEPVLISAELDLAEVERFRAAIPSLANERPFAFGE